VNVKVWLLGSLVLRVTVSIHVPEPMKSISMTKKVVPPSGDTGELG
jgi:hypothetical protein